MCLRLDVIVVIFSVAAAISPEDSSPQCSKFMNDASFQFFGLTVDMLGRFSSTARVGRRSHISRIATVVAQDLVGSLLGLAEASFVYICHVAGCGGCGIEHSSSTIEVDLPENSLQRHREMVTQRLQGFVDMVEGSISKADTNHILLKAVQVALASRQDEVTVEAKTPQDAATNFRQTMISIMKMVTGLHRAVVEVLQSLSTLQDLQSTSSLAGYVRAAANSSEPNKDGEKVPTWPWTVRLAQRVVRPRLPFMRNSIFCDANGEALYRETSLPATLGNAPPFKDSSGSYTWLSVPALSLLQALHHAGHHSTYTYWSVLPLGMYERSTPYIPCNEAHGILYDPTVCLEDAGWGGVLFLLAGGGASPHKRSWTAVRSSPRREESIDAEGDAATDSPSYISELVPSTWPPEPPQEPVDLLFLHPMADNCRLLPDVLSAEDAVFRLLYVPVNPTLPPPMRAAPAFGHHQRREQEGESRNQTEQELISRSFSHNILAQCSLAEAAALLQPYGYELLHMEHIFAVFVLQAAAAPLRRHFPQGEKSAVEEEPQDLHNTLVSMFETWRLGWFCSPVSRYLLSLERTAGSQQRWFGLHDEANATLATCAFLARHNLHDERCKGVQAPAAAQDWHSASALALRQRLQWALEMRDPLPGVSFHLQSPHGFCTAVACECMAPYRGRRCDEMDASQQAQGRPYAAAVQYLVNADPVHLAELLYALRNLWQRFNSRHDYPVQVFHDGLPDEVRVQIVLASPNRIWFHHLPADFLPAEMPEDLRDESEDDGVHRVSHHSFSVGYRAQSRFRAGPVFAHPASRNLDYILSLDTDSMFPADLSEDPFAAMHRDESIVLLFVHAPLTSPASCRNFWGSTLPYVGHKAVDLKSILLGIGGKFLRKFLVAQLGWDGGPLWSHRVTMTDWEVLRVSFFRPGTEYYDFFEYLDSLGGFWLHRWGDHAVRGMGTAVALELLDMSSEGTPRRRLRAMRMQLPYAHQQACFCGNQECVAHGPEASGEPLWPPSKPIWECGLNGTSPMLIMEF